MGQEGVELVRQQIDAVLAAVVDFFGRYGWTLALVAILGWWAWQVVEPRLREAANRRAIRCVLVWCISVPVCKRPCLSNDEGILHLSTPRHQGRTAQGAHGDFGS